MAEVSTYLDDIKYVCGLASLPWRELDNCSILITGASGLIGSCLVDILLNKPDRSYRVVAAVRNIERARRIFSSYVSDKFFSIIEYDICSPLASDTAFDYIINCASNASPNFFAKFPVDVMKASFVGVDNLLSYGIKNKMKRFLQVSTGEVYGEGDGRVFTEDYSGYVDCTSARSCYPSSKRAAETLCAAYSAQYGVDYVVARPCHVYGPHYTENDNRVYAQFINNVIDGEDIILKSKGEQFRSWCYVVDCASAILHILLKGISGEAYNIADNSSNISIKSLAEIIAMLAGKRVIVRIADSEEQKGYNVVSKSVFSTEKTCQLGWQINGTIEKNLGTTIAERKRINIKNVLSHPSQ